MQAAAAAQDARSYAERHSVVSLFEVRVGLKNRRSTTIRLVSGLFYGYFLWWVRSHFQTLHKLPNSIENFAQKLLRRVVLERPDEPIGFLKDEVEKQRGEDTKHTSGEAEDEPEAVTSEDEATEYLEKHRLPQLLEELCGMLLVQEPEDPLTYLSDELGRVGASGGKRDPFFTDDDLRGMFSLFDPTGSGKISEAQARVGLHHLGIRKPSSEPSSGKEEEDEEEEVSTEPTITEQEWVARAREALSSHRIVE